MSRFWLSFVAFAASMGVALNACDVPPSSALNAVRACAAGLAAVSLWLFSHFADKRRKGGAS